MSIRLLLPLLAVAMLTGAGLHAWIVPPAPQAVPGPGPQHELLKQFPGTWDVFTTMAMTPGVQYKAVETSELVCGGMWLAGCYKGDFNGMPFEAPGKNMMTGEPCLERHTIKFIDDDHITSRILAQGPDGEWLETMRFEYTRRESEEDAQ